MEGGQTEFGAGAGEESKGDEEEEVQYKSQFRFQSIGVLPRVLSVEWCELVLLMLREWRYEQSVVASLVDEEAVMRFVIQWPRGQGAGELLDAPLPDRRQLEDTKLSGRGVSARWLEAVARRLRGGGVRLSTRMFVDLVVRSVCGARGALYFFLPKAFRGRPSVFIAHSWDAPLDELMCAGRGDKEDVFLWIDVFAADLHPSAPHLDVNAVVRVVDKCANTKLLVSGSGPAYSALEGMHDSWSALAVSETPEPQLRVRVHATHEDFELHRSYARKISAFSLAAVRTKSAADQGAVESELQAGAETGWETRMIRAVRRGFFEAYAPGPRGEEGMELARESIRELYADAPTPQGRGLGKGLGNGLGMGLGEHKRSVRSRDGSDKCVVA